MPCSGVIMMEGEDSVAEVWGNVGMILVEQDIVIDAPVLQGRAHGGCSDAIKGLLGC
jgi:hypothetical protein